MKKLYQKEKHKHLEAKENLNPDVVTSELILWPELFNLYKPLLPDL